MVTNTENQSKQHQLVVKKYGTTKTIKMVRDQKSQCKFYWLMEKVETVDVTSETN